MGQTLNTAEVVLAVLLGAATAGSAQPTEVLIETALDADGALAGSTVRAALQVQLDAGFHVNSHTPLEDFLIPTELRLDLPEGIAVTEIAYPEAGLLEQVGADTPLAVFEERFAIGATLVLAEQLPPGIYTLPGTLRYQACDETMCYLPANADVTWTLRIVPAGVAITRQRAELFDGITFGGEHSVVPSTAPRATAAATAGAPVETADVDGLLSQFDILGTTGGYLNRDDFLGFMTASESGEAQQGWFEGQGPLAILALILIGGLALNLTPCVLPMIPINIAIIGAGARAGSRLRGLLLGGVYGAAMAVVYGVLGLVVILTAGTFGTINASPWFNLGIAALFVVLALAMFDVLVIDFSRFQSKLKIGNNEQGSFLVAFGMGAVARAPGRSVRRPGRHPGHPVRQQPVRDGQLRRAAPPPLSWSRHGAALADRRRGFVVPAEAWAMDGVGQAGLRRVHSRHGGVLRLRRVRHLRKPLGRRRPGSEQCRGKAE